MSIEKQARRALRRMVFWRCVLNIIDLPRDLLRIVGGFFRALSDFFDDCSQAVFYLELHAAREYRLLTGVDMGVATGADSRYMGTTAEAFDSAVAEQQGYDEDDD